ncbi:metalloregulator ArsR/SmtB family transcription factor [Nocardioides sp. TF02-7]|uniref:metalloregulator ArsR/SmtB family transcription factor n=1 Tax=Nocardioides sp. TF02-7 TaxID=2917724 RepID=UPI001F0639CB|nr:metalloregulator ArsR/SmtB family transcription factor [Nocardioides sp. TF02-7]UMG93752.1 metalloregulator ArsR/SmtB family transcription factor [Nocardioides sp. TF02-7]
MRTIDPWTALGDPTRRRILARVAHRPSSVTTIAGELPVSRPAVSQHLQVLLQARLVDVRPQGAGADLRRAARRPRRAAPRAGDVLAARAHQLQAGHRGSPPERNREGARTMTVASSDAEAAEVRLDIVVDVPRERAFADFVERFDQIKPREYNLLAVDVEETVFEPRVGGHVYDRGVDGSECRWARVLAFEPPERFVISWDIDLRWQLETDPDRTSEVEVTFVELGPEQTRVDLVHRHLERHGDGWEGYREGLAADDGWPVFLERYRALTG